MKLLGSTKDIIHSDKNSENVPRLISISSHSLIFLKTMNTEFSEVDIWFTDQNNNALEIEDNVNISLIMNTN